MKPSQRGSGFAREWWQCCWCCCCCWLLFLFVATVHDDYFVAGTNQSTLLNFCSPQFVSAFVSDHALLSSMCRGAGCPRSTTSAPNTALCVLSPPPTFGVMSVDVPKTSFPKYLLPTSSDNPFSQKHPCTSTIPKKVLDHSKTRKSDSNQQSSLRKWEADFAALIAFQKQHGHWTIPKDETRLYRFVKNLRQNYKHQEQQEQEQQQQEEEERDTEEQHQHQQHRRNEEIESHWTADFQTFSTRTLSPLASSSSLSSRPWSTPFPKSVGEQNTPPGTRLSTTLRALSSSFSSSSSLQESSSEQRRHSSSLTPDRIRRLESIGFPWTPRQDSWNCKYDQLAQFWKEHGHTSLSPDADYQDLRSWMTYQRIRYRQQISKPERRGERSSAKALLVAPLSSEQIEQLERIHFSWTPQDETWWNQFRQLESFHRAHGNWDVRGRENHKLRCWKNTLRRQCREYVQTVALDGTTEGVHVSGLNAERLEALRRIRFCWLPSSSSPTGSTLQQEKPPEDIFRGYQ